MRSRSAHHRKLRRPMVAGALLALLAAPASAQTAGSAEIVITTHRARESAMRDASNRLMALDVVREIGSIIRVEE